MITGRVYRQGDYRAPILQPWVDTVGFNDRTLLDDHYDLSHTTQLHVIERFKLVDDGNTIQVSFTVDDPGAFNEPWCRP